MAWWRNWIRKNTKPIDPTVAQNMRRILSTIYFFTAWNALAYTLYRFFTKTFSNDENYKESPSRFYASVIGTPDAKVYRFKGFKKVDEFEITGTFRPEPGRIRLENERAEAVKNEENSSKEDLGLLIEETNSL